MVAQPLQITRLRVSGFKSFSDPIELDIADGLTGVVGPNGCGKSNIVEALRWVMGESSAKGLRGGEMDDVIFNGSSLRPGHDLAEVCLTLNGDLTLFGSDGASGEVQISRRIGRGTGSVFRINGKEARARDVQVAFADFSSGARSAAMVGQGQVAFIVEAKPEERRRLLEDAAGIGGMHARRREAELKLQATEANLVRVSDRLAQQQHHRDELEKQSQQARRFVKLQADIRKIDAILHLAELDAVIRGSETARRDLAGAEAAGRIAAEGIAALKARRQQLQDELATVRSEREAKAASHARLAERLDGLQAEYGMRASRLAELEDHQARLLDDERQTRSRLESGVNLRRTLEARLAAWTDEVQSLPAKIEELESRAGIDSAQLEQATLKLRELSEQRAELRATRQSFVDRESALARRAEMVRNRLDEIDARLATLDSNSRPAQTDSLDCATDLATQLDAAKNRRRALVDEAAQIRIAHAEATTAQATLTEEARRHEFKQREAEADARRLEDRLDEIETQSKRLDHRKKGLDQDLGAARNRLGELAAQKLGERLEAGRQTRHDVEQSQEAAIAAEHEARERLVAAQDLAEQLKSRLATLEAEQRALEPMLATQGDQPLWRDLVVKEGFEQALAAALGDDLLADHDTAASAHWCETSKPFVQLLPVGATPLGEVVQGSAKLSPRLSQIGYVDSIDRARALQGQLLVGQRLVTREGGLWRWDGFVRLPDAADPGAAKVRQHRRWVTLLAETDRTKASMHDAQTAFDAIREAHQAAAHERATLGKQLDLVSRQLDGLERDEASQQREHRFLMEREGELGRECEALAGELESHHRKCEALRTSLSALGDLAAQAQLSAEIAARLHSATATLEQLSSRLGELDRARDGADLELDDIAQKLEQERIRAEQARRERDAELLRKRSEYETLLRDRAQTQADLAELEAEVAASQPETEALLSRLSELDTALLEARGALDGLQERQSATIRELGEARQRLAELNLQSRQARRELAQQENERRELEARAQDMVPRLRHYTEEIEAARAAMAGEDERRRLDDEIMAIGAAIAALDRRMTGLSESQAELEREFSGFEQSLIESRERVAVCARDIEHAEAREVDVRRAAVERLDRLPQELRAELDQLAMPDETEIQALAERLQRFTASRDRLGAVNLRAAEEVAELETELARTRKEEAELQAAVERLKRGIGTLNSEARQRLQAVFGTVDDHFRRLFTRLFGGGRAHLRLVDLDDPLRAGLELEAMPPGKKLQNVGLLSGGEKSMTALALIFALFLTRPSPLCVLDEVDAALDDANVDRFILMMDEIARETGTRFLVVTHHPLTMARMHRLYGVTMAEKGVSRLVSVALEQAVEMRAA